MNNRQVGTLKEQQAAAFLVQNEFLILETNFRCRLGELDLIAQKDDQIHFVEVKYRKNTAYGYPAEAVDYRKQSKICKVSDYYRLTHPSLNECGCHFDVIAFLGDELIFYLDAFEYRF